VSRTSDLLLVFESDPESVALLQGVAQRLGCEHIEIDSAQSLREVLAVRQPTIAVLAVDRFESDGSSMMHTLAELGARPATLLVGAITKRVMMSARRAAESLGLPVLGVASRPLDSASIEQLLAPHLSVAPPIPVAELEQALVEQELILHYQPKLSITTAEPKIHAVEALVRWQHPRRGLLQPGQFLKAFEEHDMMLRLTDFVITESVRQAGLWRARGLPLGMVVNLSPKLVRDREFPERIATLLQENDFLPDHLVLEVPESPGTENRDLLLDVFTRLRILGVGLALDNFGTGLSSLTELYRMPYSEITIDHSLLVDALQDRDARLIVGAVTGLAHELQLPVCAKGVESRRMLELARSFGFDTAQGRFFSEAVPGADVERIVRVWPGAGPAATGNWRAVEPFQIDSGTTTTRLRRLPIGKGKIAK
jgi:EAL domain-containing protein (putative c-di-GMP-specific phosphodiesterase class I)